MNKVYEQIKLFKKKYPHTVTWFRLKKHSEVVNKHLNPGEIPIYCFAGQKTENMLDLLLVGYSLVSITPDLFNDLSVYEGILWGRVTIDTVKEVVNISNIDKRALPEIETAITSFMMEEKKKYKTNEN